MPATVEPRPSPFPSAHGRPARSRALAAAVRCLCGVQVLLAVCFAFQLLALRPAAAASCYLATSASSHALCWLDLTNYSPVSGSGTSATAGVATPLTFTLPDGSTLSLTMTTTISSPASGFANMVVGLPTWGGSALGNSLYAGISGKPAIYTGDGTITTQISGATLRDPSGTALSTITMAGADAESTNNGNGESVSWGTSGPALSQLQLVPAIGGSTTNICSLSGTGTASATCNNGLSGNVGAYILDAVMSSGSTFSTGTNSAAWQGYAFAVDIAQLTAKAAISGRSGSTDEFTVKTVRSGTTLSSASTSGTGTSVSSALGVFPTDTYTLSETASSGSLSNYVTTYACTNAVSSSTTLPSGTGTSVSITPAVDDEITCTFTSDGLKLTSAASAEQYVSVPAGVTDTFTLTNTSAAAATFAIGTIAVSGSSTGTLTPTGYVFGGTTYTTLTAAQSAITAAGATASNGSITLGVQYSAPATAQTISTTLSATNTSGSSTSAAVSATATDDMVAASGLQAQADDNCVGLLWTATSGASYNVYRGTSSGGETLLASVSAISSSSTYPIYTDLTAANGTTYYYEVTAVVNGTESARSAEVSVTLPSLSALTTAYQLVASYSAVGSFSSDSGFVTGAGSPSSTTSSINTASAISAPAAAAVYKTERFGSAFYYLLSGLKAGASYVVRIHEAELYFGSVGAPCTNANCTGSRVFNVTINGAAALSSFDIWAEAGGTYTALARDFTATANGSGQIYVGFCSTASLTTPTACTAPGNGANSAKIDGLQVFSAPPALALTLAASTSTPVPGSDVAYTTSFTNSGFAPASGAVISTPIPSPTCFKVGTASQPAGSSGVSATIAYSNNGGSTYAYTPVSGACGSAASGYDTAVTNVRWTFSGSVPATSTANTGSVSLTVRVP